MHFDVTRVTKVLQDIAEEELLVPPEEKLRKENMLDR
jgi:hypothetical protein